MATRKKQAPEQVVRMLATADRMLNEGKDVADVCRELQVSEQTYYRWRNQFGGMNADDAKRLRDLERENATLKRLLADAEQPAPSHDRLSLTAAPMSGRGGSCILRAPGGPVDLDRYPLRGDLRVDHVKRYVRAGVGE